MQENPFHSSKWLDMKVFKTNLARSHKQLKSDDQKTSKPSQKWGHTAIIYGKEMILFGGTGSTHNNSYTYILNLENFKWKSLHISGPDHRDSHGVCILNNLIYIFGGRSDRTLNDLWSFDPVKQTWSSLKRYAATPPQRESHIFQPLHDKFLFVYGGISNNRNLCDQHLYNIETKTWAALTCAVQPDTRESCVSCTLQNAVYIFGGQTRTEKGQDKYMNDVWKFQLDENNQGNWSKIEPIGSKKPSCRSSPSGSVYKDRYFIIIGGEGYSSSLGEEMEFQSPKKPSKHQESLQCFPKKDIWVFDCEQNMWHEILAENNYFLQPRFGHTSCTYGELIIVFGGLKNNTMALDDLQVVQLKEDEESVQKGFRDDREFCALCDGSLVQVQPSTDIEEEKEMYMIGVETSGEIDYQQLKFIAQNIESPFNAFKLLIIGFVSQSSRIINVDYEKDILMVRETDVSILLLPKMKSLFQNITTSWEYQFKVACLNLGKSFFYVQNDEDNFIGFFKGAQESAFQSWNSADEFQETRLGKLLEKYMDVNMIKIQDKQRQLFIFEVNYTVQTSTNDIKFITQSQLYDQSLRIYLQILFLDQKNIQFYVMNAYLGKINKKMLFKNFMQSYQTIEIIKEGFFKLKYDLMLSKTYIKKHQSDKAIQKENAFLINEDKAISMNSGFFDQPYAYLQMKNIGVLLYADNELVATIYDKFKYTKKKGHIHQKPKFVGFIEVTDVKMDILRQEFNDINLKEILMEQIKESLQTASDKNKLQQVQQRSNKIVKMN